MPPRFAYWTIILDKAPTAFRARDREELLPTLKQLQRKNTDAAMKWFQDGKLWDSPDEARAARVRARARPRRERRFAGEPRGREWRPGGAHKDPRARFKGKRRKQK
ncbi:MAG: hypothetical protein HY654_10780 [Acidobacteria bacterium]|nr:hypothetical protein [Acidobacteriota bacterium]